MANDPKAAPVRWHAVLESIQRGYAEALLGGAAAEAERVVRDAIDAGVPEAVISGEVIAPAMRTVGERWADGTLGIGDEHLATEISTRILALQREVFRSARGRARHRVILAAVEGERHALGLNMAAGVLLRAGYDVRLLGADLPMAEIGPACERHRPAVVGFSATVPSLAVLLSEAIEEVRFVCPRAGILVGGGATPEALGSLPGVALCRHVSDAVELTDGLVHRAALN